MSVNPVKIAIFVIAVLAGLLGLTLIAGDQGFQFGSVRIKYPTLDKFLLHLPPTDTTSFDSIENKLAILKSEVKEDSLRILRQCDTCGVPGLSHSPKGFALSPADSQIVQRIELPPSNSNYLHSFFKKLESIASKKASIRIIHYGDSQIEGDRITAYLRQRLQSMFGGNGPGFLPVKPVYEQVSATITNSDNWDRYAVFDPAKAKQENRKFGLFQSYSRFTPQTSDSITHNSELHSAWVTVGTHKLASRNAKNFKKVVLHYGNLHTRLVMEVHEGDSLIVSDTLISDGEYHAYTVTFDKTPQEVKYTFTGVSSPDFYGFTLEGGYGLGVDNVAMRGAIGTHFTSTDFQLNARMAKALNVQLVILQYGGNTVPYLKSEKQIANYIKDMGAQIRMLRRLNPDMSIIFVGPADMATRIDGEFQTFPLLEKLIEELRIMCNSHEIPYWDTYQAMGGKNSILTWSEHGLVAKDYVHFSPRGTKIIAEALVRALLWEYNDYKQHAQ